MLATQIAIRDQLTQISKLDFRDNQKLILLSYVLRLIGAVGFSAIFFGLITQYYSNEALSIQSLLTIKILGVPDLVSIGLIVLDVVFVLWLHELVHATVFYLHTGAPPRMGMRGAMIFASAEGFFNRRNAMIINALAPCVVISILAVLLIPIIPASALAWIFIPTVVNAAASGGDFMAVYWLLTLPAQSRIEDHGDVLIAYV